MCIGAGIGLAGAHFFDKPRLRYAAARVPATTVFHMTNRFTLKVRLLALLLLTADCAASQSTPAEIAENPERAAGIYHPYEYLPGPAAPVPAGYTPFYISHYSRHGSRYHASASTYTEPLEILRKAAGEGILTPKGREVLAKAESLAAGAEGRYGDLSPRGVAEHRAIAGRMYAAYPAVFSTRKGRVCRIESRSTQVPRCMLSMAAFNERLKELNPAIRITRDASVRDFGYMAYGPSMSASSAAALKVADSLFGARMNPGRVMKSLFTDPAGIGDPVKLMRQLYILTSVIQDADHLGIEPFYDIFTDRDLYDLWACENVRRYLQMGPSARFGDPIVADAKSLLRNIVETAREVVEGRSDLAASLRFGHDVFVIPLVALLGVEGASARVESLDDVASAWSVEKVSPMAANVQFVFFRNAKTGDVRVRVLLNERDARLPVAGGPYYPWKDLEQYCESLYE